MARFHTFNCLTLIVVVLSQALLLGGSHTQPYQTPDLRSPHESQTTVDSLPLTFQYALSRDLGRDDSTYHFSRDGETFQADNPKSGLSANLNDSGFQVRSGEHTWSLALSAWGREAAMQAPSAATSADMDANKLTYARSALSEWFLNGPFGLQQGWQVNEPPYGNTDQPLTLSLTMDGDLRAVVRPDKRSLALVDSSGFSALGYGGLTAYDATGSELNAWFETQDDQLLVRVADAGAAYPITVDPWLQVSKITTSKPQDDDLLGYSLALSADGGTLVAGAPRIDPGDSPGTLYVYQRPGEWATTHLYTAKLTASDGLPGDQLGYSVSISADGSLIAAGAPYHDGIGPDGTDQGALYLFQRPSGGWVDSTESVKLSSGTAPNHDLFGWSVALSGDGAILAAGAYGYDDLGGNERGAVYLFERPAEGWSTANAFDAKLTASDAADNDQFGWSVAANRDGSIIAAGAKGRSTVYLFHRPDDGWQTSSTFNARLTASDGGSIELGYSLDMNDAGDIVVAGALTAEAAFLYQRVGSQWTSSTETARLSASDAANLDFLGWSVAVDQTGNVVAAGAIFYEDQFPTEVNRGAVYLYQRPPGGWISTGVYNARLTSADSLDGDWFGTSVALSADGTALISSAPYHDGGGEDRGALYTYQSPSSGWATTDTYQAKLIIGENGHTELTGISIALSADGRTLVVGAPYYPSGTSYGAAYVYERPGRDWVSSAVFKARLTASDGQPLDYFGNSVTVSADGSIIVVGGQDFTMAVIKPGAVYVFERPAGGWTTTSNFDARLTAGDGQGIDDFGFSVALSSNGDTLAVGAPYAGDSSQGAVYIFIRQGEGWTTTMDHTARLTAPHFSVRDNLGYAVALSTDGSTLLSGAPWQDAGGSDRGAAYVYLRPPDGWVSTNSFNAQLTASDGQDDDHFGSSVAASADGTTLAVGHPVKSAHQGAIYVYTRPASGWNSRTETAILTVSDAAAGDILGNSLALNTDGSQLVASAPYHSIAGTSRGALYLFTKPESGWASTNTFDAKLTANDGQDHDTLGYSVAFSPDSSTIVTGAPNEDDAGTTQGAAYVFALHAAPQFTSGTPPSPVEVSQPYTHTFTAKNYPPATFAVSDGIMPPGLTLDGESGMLSGIPTRTGTYTFTVSASNGIQPDATQAFTILVLPQGGYRCLLPLVINRP